MNPSIILNIDAREVEISHPDKILIQPHISKLQIANYYQSVRKDLMHFGTNRPLSMVRYPKGYPDISFFQRNKPKWAPSWIHDIKLGVNKKANYIILDQISVLLWLVNLGSLEFHGYQVKAPNFMNPDFLVFDLDPPKGSEFSEVRDLALELKPIVESFGYKTFAKTSGKSGVHIYCPIEPRWSFDEVFVAAEEIGKYIVGKISNTTLRISKKERTTKTLIDIYRNHAYQSMVMPYSIRATPSASVSMPLAWSDLKEVISPTTFTIESVPQWMATHQNPWQSTSSNTVKLHTVNG